METLTLLSDSTGDLGERFLQALMTQFPKGEFQLRVFSFVDQKDKLNKILQGLPKLHPILFHTTVRPPIKRRIESFAEQHHIPVYDLTGKVAKFLEKNSGLRSRTDPAALHELNKEYENRIEALDFTVGHDDGLRDTTLEDADIILAGVSRTSKTPTSIYLAYKGYRVANVPIVAEAPVPDFIGRNLQGKIVGLTIQPERLQTLRLRRTEQELIPGTLYTDLESIYRELDIANRIFLKCRCPVIDVTSHAVEETGALVLKLLDKR